MIEIVKNEYSGYPYKANVKTNSFCFLSDVEDDEAKIEYKRIIEMFSEVFRNTFHLYVIIYYTLDRSFNRVEKYYGIWKDLAKNNIAFQKSYNEIYFDADGKHTMIAYAQVESNEISNLFHVMSRVIPITVLANQKIMDGLFHSSRDVLCKPERIMEYLLNENAILIDHLDLGVDGSSLIIYSKR